jgi:hypothetical protein
MVTERGWLEASGRTAAAVTATISQWGPLPSKSNTWLAANVVRQDQPSGSSGGQGSPVNLVISSGQRW